jgi:hypothetical protein
LSFIEESELTQPQYHHICAIHIRKTRRQETNVQRKQEMTVFPRGVNQTIPNTRGKKKNVVQYCSFKDISSLPFDTRYPHLYGIYYIANARVSMCTP